MNEKRFPRFIKYGGLVLILSLIGNVYFVLRNIEVHRDAARWDRQAQMMTVKTQVMESVLREFTARAGSDRNIARILASGPAAASQQTKGAKR
jgi:hypothetical protein